MVNHFLFKCMQKAGDGNRTHVSSLEGWCSTIELHPRKNMACISQQAIFYNSYKCLSIRF